MFFFFRRVSFKQCYCFAFDETIVYTWWAAHKEVRKLRSRKPPGESVPVCRYLYPQNTIKLIISDILRVSAVRRKPMR